MAKICIIPSTVMPVTIEQARANLRVDGDDLDALISMWVDGITSDLEEKTGQCIMKQTWEVRLDSFSASIRLPHPAMSVVSVDYLDPQGYWEAIDAAGFDLVVEEYRSLLLPATGAAWPATQKRRHAVVVTVVCGHGNTAASTPKNVRLYILAKLAEQFDPITRTEKDTVQSTFIDGLLNACKTYE